MKNPLIILLVLLVFTSLVSFFWGVHYERSTSENAIELAMCAAAQQYNNDYENDTTGFDYYGTTGNEAKASKYVLPENARTKAADPKAPLHKKSTPLRKRN